LKSAACAEPSPTALKAIAAAAAVAVARLVRIGMLHLRIVSSPIRERSQLKQRASAGARHNYGDAAYIFVTLNNKRSD
jgi:hypothetical protein